MVDISKMLLADLGRSKIDDRRDQNYSGAWHDDGSFAFDRIPQSLRDLGVSMGNTMWGTPQIPESPRSALSDALGREDMKIEPNVGRSLLQRAIDGVQLELNQLGIARGPSWADKLTEQRTR